MSEEMVALAKALFMTVGCIEVLKNFIVLKNKKIWAVVMIPLCFGFTYVSACLPPFVSLGILAVCGSQLFYSDILQNFRKLFDGLATRFAGTATPPTSAQ